MAGQKTLALIDGMSIFYRGYYAMPNLTTKDGLTTGGVYGFTCLALELIKRIQPDYVAVAWDKPKTNTRRRRQIYHKYKANRKPAPADFYAQIPVLQQLLEALGWPLYQADDYEADDIMGTLAREANKNGIHTVLISSDLDMLQLINDDTEVYAMKKGLSNLERVDKLAFEDKYGLRISQFLDLKSLKGDSSDNIPGVLGIGEKTAGSLLRQFGSLDGIYQHLDQVTGSIRRKLIAGRDSAYMSQQLAKIWCDAPIALDLEAADVDNLNRVKLHQMLHDLQFSSLIKRLPANFQLTSDHKPLAADSRLPKLAWADLPTKLDNPVVVTVVGDKLLLSDRPDLAYQTSLSQGAKLLANRQIITHDAKALSRCLIEANLVVNFAVKFDTKHAAFLLDSLVPTSDLLACLLSLGVAEPTPLDYLAAIYYLWDSLGRQLAKATKLTCLAERIDFPLQVILARMETRGVAVDTAILATMSAKLAQQISSLEQAIWQQVGYHFNVSSPKQLSIALFNDLQLPATAKMNKSGGYPTGAKELAKLSLAHPVIDLISQYRELTKLKSTYVDALPRAVAEDGRIHTTFDQDVTSTGRLSSSNPNLQNIPTRTDRGREIKRSFIAPAGSVLVNADYAQFELRLAAALAGDQRMIAMFADSAVDIHTLTAAEVYGVTVDQVTSQQRRHAKVINFGVLYGMSPHGLVEATGMSYAAAKALIERYFAIRQPVRDFLDQTLRQADKLGYVETLFGRRRPTPDVQSANFMVREAAKRAAANMPIQGTEADLMKMAMLKVEQIAGAKQIMQIHDSIMVECATSEAKRVEQEMKQIMENIYPDLGVRLLVDTKIGRDWSEL